MLADGLLLLRPHDDVVNGDVDELNEEPDEAHDPESDRSGDSDLTEFLPAIKYYSNISSRNLDQQNVNNKFTF